MTVLVTGGAGYIGSHMVHALAEAGENVVVVDNLTTGFSAFVPEGVPLFIGDAGDENLVEPILDAVRAYATVGEISGRLRAACGASVPAAGAAGARPRKGGRFRGP